jgi:hypothetical protein
MPVTGLGEVKVKSKEEPKHQNKEEPMEKSKGEEWASLPQVTPDTVQTCLFAAAAAGQYIFCHC